VWERNAYILLVGRPRSRWEDDVRVVVREIGWECMDWILLIQDRDQWLIIVNMVRNLQFP
jgi:hypothetical protein